MAKGVWREGRRRGVHKTKRIGFLPHVREYLWPSMGMRAFLRWTWLGLLRQAGKPHYVAMGFACGVWTAFFPLLGTHILVVALLCWVLGASFVAALAGTMIGNPWTYGPIWASSFRLGAKILHLPKGTAHAALHEMHWRTLGADFSTLFHDVIWPTLLGGMIIGLPVAVFFYFVVYWQITLWRERRTKR
jgi:hypothetical protein